MFLDSRATAWANAASARVFIVVKKQSNLDLDTRKNALAADPNWALVEGRNLSASLSQSAHAFSPAFDSTTRAAEFT